MHIITFETRNQFRCWLEQFHQKENGIWIQYFKKHTNIPTITYEEAVQEALCYGWIDSKVQTIDALRYKQVFTPRKPRSIWSDKNKERVKQLIEAGLMKPAGMKSIENAKKFGKWQKSYGTKKPQKIPDSLKTALMQNPLAWENFNNFAPSYRSTYIAWVALAKRPETIRKRIEKVLEYAINNQKPGMM